jgi:hypothetical protein
MLVGAVLLFVTIYQKRQHSFAPGPFRTFGLLVILVFLNFFSLIQVPPFVYLNIHKVTKKKSERREREREKLSLWVHSCVWLAFLFSFWFSVFLLWTYYSLLGSYFVLYRHRIPFCNPRKLVKALCRKPDKSDKANHFISTHSKLNSKWSNNFINC